VNRCSGLRALRKAITPLLSVLLAFSSCQCFKKSSPEAEQAQNVQPNTFALFYMTSMRGWVEPCGCTSEPLGGIARLARVVLDSKNQYGLGVSLIDGGDVLFDSLKPTNPADLCQENARIDLLLSTLHDLSCIGTFPGQYDDVMGVDFRDEKLKNHKLTNLTESAKNGFITGKDPAFRLGILFLDEANASSIDAKATNLKNEGAKAVVVVTHQPRSFFFAKKAAMPDKAEMPHVDIVILGVEGEETPPVAQKADSEGPVFVSAGKQGQYLGLVEFRFNKEGGWTLDDRQQKRQLRISLLTQRITTFQAQMNDSSDPTLKEFLKTKISDAREELDELAAQKDAPVTDRNYLVASTIALSRKIDPNPSFDAKLKAYESKIPELVAQCESKIACPEAVANEAHFVGAETCKSCHNAAYEFWKNAVYSVPATDEKGNSIERLSGHTKAYETLAEKHKTEDRSCVGCHTTGFMQPGGFCKVKEVGSFKGVQCESCHGAGSLHVATADKRQIKRAVPEATCRGCHHVPHIPTTESFNYEQRLTKILGEGHGALLLSKIKHQAQN